MFAVRMKTDLLFARQSSLSRPARLYLGVFYETIGKATFYQFINLSLKGETNGRCQ
jgi:hypothetical protein